MLYLSINQDIHLHSLLREQRELQHSGSMGLKFLDLPMFNRYIMQNEGKLFQSSYPKSFGDLVGKNGVIIVHGEQQKRLHAIVDVRSKRVAINLMINQLMGVSSASEIKEMACKFSDFLDGCIYVPINLGGFTYHTAMKERKGIIAKFKNIIANGQQQGGSIERSGVLGSLVEEENLNDNPIADFILNLQSGSEAQTQTFANNLISSNLLTLCFAYLGLFPTDQMRSNVYLILDRAFGPSFGQPMRDVFFYLPVDLLDLLFFLGQKSSIDPQLALCQCASLLFLYVSSHLGEGFADDTPVLASLEQYILVNSNYLFCMTGDSLMLAQSVHLYGLHRGFQRNAKMSYSPETEKTLLNLLAIDDLELFSFCIHPMALKWLFQQERIMTYLSNQILKFCRLSRANESQLIVYPYGSQTMKMQLISALVVSGDNYVAQLLVSLMIELQGDGGEDDMICVLNTMTEILSLLFAGNITFSSLQPDWFTIGSLLLAFTHPNKFVDIYQSCKIFDPGGLLMIITPISF
ncbi:Protein PRD1 [Dendrobium catenatum]|uniref:Protein PRD1 n=2 Tax=Dendrobium catenatum TaxID=906689 RepID=A0A2I0VIS7_9ASPA|nr:Protein PRD1 [Dendrobium catenatum]